MRASSCSRSCSGAVASSQMPFSVIQTGGAS
jgi:hypothetical protein